MWQRIGLCFLFAIGKFSAGAYWIFVSLVSYSEIHVALAIGLFATFLLIAGTFFSILAFFAFKSPSPVISSLVFAAGVTVVEVLFSLPWALSFPWQHLGYALIDTPISAFAPIGGVWMVSFVGAFTAATLYHLLNRQWHGFAAAVMLWCIGLLMPLGDVDDGEMIKVVLVQGNVALEDKWTTDAWKKSLAKYAWLTKTSPAADLVLWPESAVPINVAPFEDDILDAADKIEGGLVFGALETRKVIGGASATFNVAVAIDQDRISYFRKEQLVPFGEYIPARSVFGEILQPLGYPISSITPFKGVQAALKIDNFTLGTAICYEIAYPQLVRRRASSADLILVLSEDSWLGDTAGPWQHLQIARMRALELNRPLVRATNDGVTASVLSNGSVSKQLARYREDVLVDKVTLGDRTTFYARFGLIPIAVLIIAVLLAMTFTRHRSLPGDERSVQ